MKLMIGGAYQGKTALAMGKYGLLESDIEVCSENAAPRFDKKCVSHIERFAFFCVKNGLEPKDELFAAIGEDSGMVLIADDISCGVVPMNVTQRAWREATGRMLSAISQRSSAVSRVFCGIEQILKG